MLSSSIKSLGTLVRPADEAVVQQPSGELAEVSVKPKGEDSASRSITILSKEEYKKIYYAAIVKLSELYSGGVEGDTQTIRPLKEQQWKILSQLSIGDTKELEKVEDKWKESQSKLSPEVLEKAKDVWKTFHSKTKFMQKTSSQYSDFITPELLKKDEDEIKEEIGGKLANDTRAEKDILKFAEFYKEYIACRGDLKAVLDSLKV